MTAESTGPSETSVVTSPPVLDAVPDVKEPLLAEGPAKQQREESQPTPPATAIIANVSTEVSIALGSTHCSTETQTDEIVVLSAEEYKEFNNWKVSRKSREDSSSTGEDSTSAKLHTSTVAVNAPRTESPSKEVPPAGIPLKSKTDAGCCSMM